MSAEPLGDTYPSCDEIRDRYGLTRSEARLCQLLARGTGLRRAAQELGIRYGSARAYLKIAFDKTGAHSQAQLVSLLLRDRLA